MGCLAGSFFVSEEEEWVNHRLGRTGMEGHLISVLGRLTWPQGPWLVEKD